MLSWQRFSRDSRHSSRFTRYLSTSVRSELRSRHTLVLLIETCSRYVNVRRGWGAWYWIMCAMGWFKNISVHLGNKASVPSALTGRATLVRQHCAWVRFRSSNKQNKKLTDLVVIGSDFQKTLAHLPFWATTISTGRGINLSFAQRSQLKTPINERLNFILLPLWRSLYGHDSEMDATIGARSDRHLAVTNATWIGSRSGHAILVTAVLDWPLRFRGDARLVRFEVGLSGSLMSESHRMRAIAVR